MFVPGLPVHAIAIIGYLGSVNREKKYFSMLLNGDDGG